MLIVLLRAVLRGRAAKRIAGRIAIVPLIAGRIRVAESAEERRTVVLRLALLLRAGWNNTAYYPSLAEMQSSLTIYNSSSSEFTLKVMSVVSLMIPFVAAYIWYAWRAMNRKPITREEIRGNDHMY